MLAAQKTVFFVSTSDNGGQPSMGICELDEDLGELSLAKSLSVVDCPNYMAISDDRQTLYTVGHEKFSNGNNENCVHSFSLQEGVLNIGKLNSQSSFGGYPVHISLSGDGHFLFVANYVSGSVASYKLLNDGSIGEKLSNWNYEGEGQPKAHFIHASNDGRFVYAVFLGLDRVMNFTLSEEGIMSLNPDQDYLSLPEDSGPRHMAFNKNGKYAYILSEHGNTLISCAIDSASGVLSIIDFWSTLPDGYTGSSYAGAIRIHPNGEYLYCSNRGHNSIVSFRIEENGYLTKLETISEGIEWVRDFEISPSGNYLIAGFEKTNKFVLCQLDVSGGIRVTTSSLSFIKPACFVFYGEYDLSTFTAGYEIERSEKGMIFSVFNKGSQIYLNFDLQAGEEIFMEVYNLMGQKILSAKKTGFQDKEHQLDLSTKNLPPGIYYCWLFSGGETETLSFYLQ